MNLNNPHNLSRNQKLKKIENELDVLRDPQNTGLLLDTIWNGLGVPMGSKDHKTFLHSILGSPPYPNTPTELQQKIVEKLTQGIPQNPSTNLRPKATTYSQGQGQNQVHNPSHEQGKLNSATGQEWTSAIFSMKNFLQQYGFDYNELPIDQRLTFLHHLAQAVRSKRQLIQEGARIDNLEVLTSNILKEITITPERVLDNLKTDINLLRNPHSKPTLDKVYEDILSQIRLQQSPKASSPTIEFAHVGATLEAIINHVNAQILQRQDAYTQQLIQRLIAEGEDLKPRIARPNKELPEEGQRELLESQYRASIQAIAKRTQLLGRRQISEIEMLKIIKNLARALTIKKQLQRLQQPQD